MKNLIVFILMSGILATGQDPTNTVREGRGPTTEEVLEYYHVGLTSAALIGALKSPNPEVRSLAASKLAQDHDTEAIPALASALAAETAPLNRVNVAYALGKLGDKRGIATLDSICGDSAEEEWVRSDAARMMLYISKGSPACLNALFDILEHGRSDSQVNAVGLLPAFHDLSPEDSKRVLEALVNALQRGNTFVRREAIHALRRIGNPAAIPYLRRALDTEQDQRTRSELQDDIKNLGEEQPMNPNTARAGAELVERLSTSNPDGSSAGLIEALQNPNAEARLLAAGKLAREGAKEAIPFLAAALAVEKNQHVRVNIAYGLAKLGDKRGITTMESVCQDSAEPAYVRSEAVTLLWFISKENASCLAATIDLLDRGDINTRIHAAGMLGEYHGLSQADSIKVFQALTAALSTKDGSVRHNASHSLGQIGNPSAIPYLQNAIASEQDPKVRSAMEADLRKLQE